MELAGLCPFFSRVTVLALGGAPQSLPVATVLTAFTLRLEIEQLPGIIKAWAIQVNGFVGRMFAGLPVVVPMG